MTWPITALW